MTPTCKVVQDIGGVYCGHTLPCPYHADRPEAHAVPSESTLRDILQGVTHFLAPLANALGVEAISGERIDATVRRVCEAALERIAEYVEELEDATEAAAAVCDRLATGDGYSDVQRAAFAYAATMIREEARK
jgi:hypothetical protein